MNFLKPLNYFCYLLYNYSLLASFIFTFFKRNLNWFNIFSDCKRMLQLSFIDCWNTVKITTFRVEINRQLLHGAGGIDSTEHLSHTLRPSGLFELSQWEELVVGDLVEDLVEELSAHLIEGLHCVRQHLLVQHPPEAVHKGDRHCA